MKYTDLFEKIMLPSDIKDYRKEKYFQTDYLDMPADGPEWVIHLTNIMKKYGFEQLGAETNAVVYGKDSYPYVLKFYTNTDVGYKEWLNFCIKHQNNRFVPKLKSKGIKFNKMLDVIKLEKLEEITDSKESMAVRSAMLSNTPSEDKDIEQIRIFLKKFPDDDLHSSNVMQRPDGQIVVIDPLYLTF